MAQKPSHRKPRPLTEKRLENIARHYLSRNRSPGGNLITVLARRAAREAARLQQDDTAQGATPEDSPAQDSPAQDPARAPGEAEVRQWITNIVATLTREGLVDDDRYAREKAADMAARGQSQAKIRQVLAAKGVPMDVVATTLEGLSASEYFSEWQAALAYASRRGFGPFRRQRWDDAMADDEDTAPDPDRIRRELAAMARAGYGFAVATAIVEARTEDDLIPPGGG